VTKADPQISAFGRSESLAIVTKNLWHNPGDSCQRNVYVVVFVWLKVLEERR